MCVGFKGSIKIKGHAVKVKTGALSHEREHWWHFTDTFLIKEISEVLKCELLQLWDNPDIFTHE